MLFFPLALQGEGAPGTLWTGTIVPHPATPEVFSDTPTPVRIRVVNHGEKKVYLQGFRQGASKKVHFFFYHRQQGRGWKPFFESLPCNHPTCQNLHVIGKRCGQAAPHVVRLGPAGSANAIKEFEWSGLLYQQVEAIQKKRERRYCYRGWVPKGGEIRIEMEYSDTVQHDKNNNLTIGGRRHTAIEFSLPPTQAVYEFGLGS